MSGLRVAHLIHNLEPGGAERRLLAVLSGLDRERFEPLIVCVDGLGPLVDEARALDIEPVVLGRAYRFDVRGVSRLTRLFRRERVMIVHGWLPFSNFYARVSGTLARVPVRIAAEGATMPARARRYAFLNRALSPFTDAYVANSEAVAAMLRKQGVPSEKIAVIPNGVAVSEALTGAERYRLRVELGASSDTELIGFVARLDPVYKDHRTFLRSVAALVSEGRQVRAAIIGDGDGRQSAERLASDLRIADRVVFTGYRADASRLMSALDVSVMLTYSEGFSSVVLESMAAGVPLVATAIPPNREAVEDGVHALLVPVGDLGATTEALRRLLDNRELAAELTAAARRRVLERYSLEAQSTATMQLYEHLLERRVVGRADRL